jgi:hypothetical protein
MTNKTTLPDKDNPEVGDIFWDASHWYLGGFLAGRREDCIGKVTITEAVPGAKDDHGSTLVRYHMEGSKRDSNFGCTKQFFPTKEEALKYQLDKAISYEESCREKAEQTAKDNIKCVKAITEMFEAPVDPA